MNPSRFFVAQTAWSASHDSSARESLLNLNVDGVVIVPTKYSPALDGEDMFWLRISDFWKSRGFEIRAVQGFLFGDNFSISADSPVFVKTGERIRIADKCRSLLGAEFMILGSPAARLFEDKMQASKGLELLLQTYTSDVGALLVENLPSNYKACFLSSADSLSKWLQNDKNLGLCLDIGNLFSWHSDKSSAFKELEDVFLSGCVRDTQFNLLEPEKLAWLLDLMKSDLGQLVTQGSLTLESNRENFRQNLKDLTSLILKMRVN